jgi:hypothetical protein
VKTALLALFLAGSTARAQDPGFMAAAQQAAMASQQAGMQAAQQAQQDMFMAGQATLQGMQYATQQSLQFGQWMTQQAQASTGYASNSLLHIPPWSAWKLDSASYLELSIKSGTVKPGTQVRIKWRGGEYAAVYYTLDGWSPTPASARYTGPITINGPVHLQAVAEGEGWNRSPILDAEYTVPSASASSDNPVAVTGDLLPAGTVLKLKTNAEIRSDSAKAGDKVSLVLDQDVTAGGAVVIPKGTPVDAVLTQVTPSNRPHRPAMLVLAVRSLQDSRAPVKLLGIETMEGRAGQNAGEAIISPGMTLHAKVAADTKLR